MGSSVSNAWRRAVWLGGGTGRRMQVAPRTRRRWWQGWLVCAALLALPGCGAFKLAYNNADTLIRLQADRYLDLTSGQSRWLAQQLVAQQGWHRKTHLPKYSATLHELARRAATRPLTAEDVIAVETTLRGWADELAVQWVPVAGKLLLQTDTEQIAYLRVKLAEQNDEYLAQEQRLTAQQRREKQRERLISGFESYLGTLNDRQLVAIDAALAAARPDRVAWIQYRRRWQKDLLGLLTRERRAPACFVSSFVTMSRERERWYGDEYRAIDAHNAAAYRQLTVSVLAVASVAQRRQLATTLEDWATLFADLARQPADLVADAQPPSHENACRDTAMTAHGVVAPGA